MKPGIRRLIEELRGARVLVVHPRDAEGDALLDQLKRIGCNVRGIWPPPVELPNDVDTVFHLVETAETPAFIASASEGGPTFVAIVDYTASSTSRSVPLASCPRLCWPARCAAIPAVWRARYRSSKRR
jgi:AmiR/NasT family two-component response regulator